VLCDWLHWLPVEQRIQYKLCPLVYKAQCGLAPQYLVDFCQPVSAVSGRGGLLSSMHSDLVVVRTETDFRERSFAVAAPLAWNQLPEKIRNLQLLQLFKSSLKTHMFKLHCLTPASRTLTRI